jgi:hypothetical protein
MSTDVTMQELELEHAELLPARETLNVCGHRSGGSSFSVTQAGQFGLVNVGPIASGNNILSGIGVLGTGVANGGGNVGIGNL